MNEQVKAHYSHHPEDEWRRLDEPLQHTEFLSTLRMVRQFFRAKGNILDVGSGPSRYAPALGRLRLLARYSASFTRPRPAPSSA